MPSVAPDDLIEALRRQGLRVTRPRVAVCEVLADAHDEHLTPSTLHARAEERLGASIDPSTVYRTLDALSEVGAIHHVHLGHGAAVIHLADHAAHQHLVCEVCGRTVDIPVDELSRLTETIAARYDFVIDSLHFAVVGRCSSHLGNEV